MDEHDDDLESEVIEGAEIEEDEFPNTAEAFDSAVLDDREKTFEPAGDGDPSEI